MDLVEIARQLSSELQELRFGPPVSHVYNPLDYARQTHEAYLERFGLPPREIVFVGMNPGPWGMAQTGVPFGEVTAVRDWLAIDGTVGKPAHEHPKRPVRGLQSERREVSGSRLWGWARDRFVSPERFFERFFVYNYCPLMFLEESGRNRTPDRLPTAEREPLQRSCDRSLLDTVRLLRPRLVVGIGGFAEARARHALEGVDVEIGRILHPSPANPTANRGWAERADAELAAIGVEL